MITEKKLIKIFCEENDCDDAIDLIDIFGDIMLSGVVPGICKNCGVISDSNEPDATENYCSQCNTNSVISINVLLGY